jgi:cell division protein FtsW (lipid II flippase)
MGNIFLPIIYFIVCIIAKEKLFKDNPLRNILGTINCFFTCAIILSVIITIVYIYSPSPHSGASISDIFFNLILYVIIGLIISIIICINLKNVFKIKSYLYYIFPILLIILVFYSTIIFSYKYYKKYIGNSNEGKETNSEIIENNKFDNEWWKNE